ncbi:bacteriocin, lactococcin 972 family protein [Enterococcus faecalis]
MKKLFTKAIITLSIFLFSVGISATIVQAATAHPHPTYKDTWTYGTNDKHGWSYYYLEAPVRLGSASSVRNIFGTVKDSARANYGWARSDATKKWNDVRLSAFYGWYSF